MIQEAVEKAPLSKRGSYLRISTKRTIQVLALVLLCLSLANLVVQFYKLGYFAGLGLPFDLNNDGKISILDFGEEANIPTWYSSFLLLLCSILLATIASAKKRSDDRYALHWSALSIVFLYLSLDEVAQIHENYGSRLVETLLTHSVGGFLRYAWVIPAAAFLLVFVVAMWNFLSNLPVKTRWLFVISGFIYVGGALVLEMVGAYYGELYGDSSVIYLMLQAHEELLEMLGAIVFIYTLMSYISTYLKDIHVYVDSG